MLVNESMVACIFICMVAKSSIHRSSRPIPSTVRLVIEFSPTDGSEDGGKLFIHFNPLEQVHIVYTSVTKLSLAERLVLLHVLGATDGNVIAVRGHRNVIICRIADRPPISCGDGMKDEDRAESCDPSPEHELEPRLDGSDENAHSTPTINFFILHNTYNNNNKYLAPYVLALALAERVQENKRLCRKIASKKTSLT
jgi:hypothetical protein